MIGYLVARLTTFWPNHAAWSPPLGCTCRPGRACCLEMYFLIVTAWKQGRGKHEGNIHALSDAAFPVGTGVVSYGSNWACFAPSSASQRQIYPRYIILNYTPSEIASPALKIRDSTTAEPP